jgi:hypothetical protein
MRSVCLNLVNSNKEGLWLFFDLQGLWSRLMEIYHPGVSMASAGFIAGISHLSSIVLTYELLLGPATK